MFKDTLIAAFNEGSYEVGSSDPSVELGIDRVLFIINRTINALPKFEAELESTDGDAVMVASESGEWINAVAIAAVLK